VAKGKHWTFLGLLGTTSRGQEHLPGQHWTGSEMKAHPHVTGVRSPRWPHCSTQPRPTAHSLVKGWNVHSLTLDSLNVSSRYYREKPHVHVHVHTTYREASRPRMPPPTAHNSSSP
jgi:hypothetical protein